MMIRDKFTVGMVLAGIILACVVSGAFEAAPALAEGGSPWWHVTTIAAPSELPTEGYGQIVVSATNLGDGEADGTTEPITIADKLPAGIVPVAILSEDGPFNNYGHGSCSLKALSCTFATNIPPYISVQMTLTVRVEPNAVSGSLSEASVEGGGAQRVASPQALKVGNGATVFGEQLYELTPEDVGGSPDVQAGSHPFQLTTTFALNETLAGGAVTPAALLKDLHFELPPGLIGNPTAIPECALGSFSAEACPLNTAVGVASVTLQISFLGPAPATVPVVLYNLIPQVGEPARFGFEVAGTPVFLDTAVRTGGDYGVVVSVSNISQNVNFLGSEVTFWGVPGDPRHDLSRGPGCVLAQPGYAPCQLSEAGSPPLFLTLPTSCATPWSSTILADSWQEPALATSAEYGLRDTYGHSLGMGGCNRLTFAPAIAVAPDGQAGSTPTGLTVGIHVPQDANLNPTGDAEATVKDTTVTLPAGVALNPAAADGLSSCGLGEIALESPAEQTCPEASKVATVEIRTPLLPNALTGAAYLASQGANPFGSLVALYIVARDPISGVLIKLAGQVTPDPVSGQLVATFKNTPQLPFEDLNLHFFGGSRAPLGTPASCGSYETTASIAPWSGNPAVESSSEFQIISGPDGSPCRSPLPFAPALTAGTTSIQAGGFSPFTMTMSREDGSQSLNSIKLRMPPGLLGTLSSVKLCGEPQADAGTCGAESLIGHTVVSVGIGGDPFTVTGGEVFITGPYKGAPYGLSIVNPAKAGPFDLGKVIVRAKIEIDRSTAALTITTDETGPYRIPTIIQGIPLQIRHVNVTIDRPSFTFNPTNCSPLQITGSLTSSEGALAGLSVPFQATNCAVLAFKPKLTASTAGKTSRANGASLHVKLAYPAGPYDANIARVKVELPKQLPSRLSTLQKACAAAVFEANPAGCPSASIIGHATATTPVLPVALTGPAYFVSHGGEAFPSLIVVLQGYGATVDLVGSTFISKQGITSSTFKTVPDVPVGSFELTLPQGPYSALAANVSLCKSKLAMPTEFVAQNGALIKTSTKIAVSGCPKAKQRATGKKKSHARKKVDKRTKRSTNGRKKS